MVGIIPIEDFQMKVNLSVICEALKKLLNQRSIKAAHFRVFKFSLKN